MPEYQLFLMEPDLAPTDYFGQVGPAIATEALATGHNNRGHLLFSDLHAQRVNVMTAQVLEKSRIFWFPTRDLTGFGGMTVGQGLTDP